jgi:serine/threonine protein kinase
MFDRGRLDEFKVKQICSAITKGVNHIHGCAFLRRDLKPENVGFGEDMTPKVIELGLALRHKSVSAK